MKRKALPARAAATTLYLFMAIAVLTVGSTSASQMKEPASVPSANAAAMKRATMHIDIPEAALKRQMQQLERAKHLLNLSAGNDHASHSAVAARHIQVAINELKMELQEKAKGSKASPPAGPSKGGGRSPNPAADSPVNQK